MYVCTSGPLHTSIIIKNKAGRADIVAERIINVDK